MEQTTLQADDRVLALVKSARSAGLPKDQVKAFINRGYVPLDGMLPFHAAARSADRDGGPEWIALGGKRGPGKSHTTLAQVGLDDCQRVNGLKVLFLRKIQKSAAESLEDIVRRVFMYIPHEQKRDGVEFPNGSRIVIGGFKDERDIEKYLGLEYDVIVIEECTQISESKKDKLRGSLRTSKPNWRPRIYLTTNADGIGLAWFKKMFVIPARKGIETITKFIDVTHIINPFINKEYQSWLNSLTGPLAAAWRDGDWDAFEGMAFPDFNQTRHTCSPFAIPAHWVKWVAVDWGWAAPFCALWFARDPDTKRIYVFREVYASHVHDRAQARTIKEQTEPNEVIRVYYADPAMWAERNKDNQIFTSVSEYKKEGITLTKADNDRRNGIRKVHVALSDLPDGEPGLVIFDCCPNLIGQMMSLACDPLNVEDVDTTQEDHAYDALKYGLTNEKKVEAPAPSKKIVNPMYKVNIL